MSAINRYKYYILVLIIALVYIIAQSWFEHGDFVVYLTTADYVQRGKDLYESWIVCKRQVTNMFWYGPGFAIFMMPFSWFSEPVAFTLFFLFQTILLMRAFYILERMLPVDKLTLWQRYLWLLISVLCSLRFILHNVESGQITILILFLSLEGLYQIFYGNKLIGSLLLGLGIHIKLMPLVFLPYLLWRKELTSAVLCIVFFICFWLTPLIFGDVHFLKQLIYHWCQAINPVGEKLAHEQQKNSFQMQGLQPLLNTYLLDCKFDDLGFKTNFTNLPSGAFNLMLQASRLLFVLFTLYFLRGTFFRPYDKSSRGFWQLSYLFLVIPIIFPQQQKYSLVLMASFFCYMIWWLIAYKSEATKKWPVTAVCFALIVLLTTFTSDLFVGIRLNYVFQCLRILTMANILAVPLLAYAIPSEAGRSNQILSAS